MQSTSLGGSVTYFDKNYCSSGATFSAKKQGSISPTLLQKFFAILCGSAFGVRIRCESPAQLHLTQEWGAGVGGVAPRGGVEGLGVVPWGGVVSRPTASGAE